MVENYSDRQEILRLRLVSRNQSGLYERLVQLNGFVLKSRYIVEELLSVGGQSVLYLARDSETNKMVVAKIPFLPYQKPAYFSNQEIITARYRLQREGTILKRLSSTLLPMFIDLVQERNPLLNSARGKEITDEELFLVIEYLDGKDFLEIARKVHKRKENNRFLLEKLVWKTVVDICNFFIVLESKPEKFFYSDLTPSNLFLTNQKEGNVRLLDAGSIITSFPSMQISAFTRAYLPCRYYEALIRGEKIFPTPQLVMYSIGKSFWEILSNHQAYPAEEPDLNCPEMAFYSEEINDLIANLITEKFGSFQNLESALAPFRDQSNFMLNEISFLLGQ